jgi:hypothetical protein
MKYFNLLFILLIASLSNLSGFTLHINNHYSTIAGKIFNLNKILKYGFYFDSKCVFRDDTIYHINYYNENKSLMLILNDKNNIKYLLKDKYNYFISFDIFKYKYKIFVKSTPIAHNYTEIDIDIRQNRNNKFNNTILNFNHYRRINNIIYKYIYNNIIIEKENKNEDELSIKLFKFFNNY